MKGLDSELNNEAMNVISLFGSNVMESQLTDPVEMLISEGQIDLDEDFQLLGEQAAAPVEKAQRLMVDAQQFPEQSMYVLEQQLKTLKENIGRMRFYLSDLEDAIPR